MKLNVKLSKRESQIAELLAWGASSKQTVCFAANHREHSPEHIR